MRINLDTWAYSVTIAEVWGMAIIRSSHERRVLDFLADSGSTISEAAENLDMRVPHASAAFKRLREKGLVSRDLHDSIRGSIHRLTPEGLDRLLEDAIARAVKYCDVIPENMDGILLARDGNQVLLGYTKHRHYGLISLPKHTYAYDSMEFVDSTGTEGAGWAVIKGGGMKWFDLGTREIVEPLERNSQSIVTWSDNSRTIGLARAKIIGDYSTIRMPVGTWFKQPLTLPPLPEILSDKNFIIGNSGLDDVEVGIPRNTFVTLKSKINKERILSQFPQKSFFILASPSSKTPYQRPVGCLKNWLRMQHPRMGGERLSEIFVKISTNLTSGNLTKISSDYRKKLLADFGTSEWIEDREFTSKVDLNGVSVDGGESIWRWAIDSNFDDISGEWPWSSRNNLIPAILSSGKLRMLIIDGIKNESDQVNCVISEGEGLGKVSLSYGRGLTIPVTLTKHEKREVSDTSNSKIPVNATELLTLPSQNFSGMALDMDERRKLSLAVSYFPSGDSDWSNRHEGSYPLASWIASPPSERQQRWERIANRLPPNWAGLLEPQITDTEVLLRSVSSADLVWKQIVKDELRQRFIFNPNEMSSLIDFLDDNKLSPTLSSSILLSSSGLSSDWDDLIERSSDVWLQNPDDSFEVLEALFGTQERTSRREKMLSKFKIHAKQKNPGSELRSWVEYLEKIAKDIPILPTESRNIMMNLPPKWWSDRSEQWLVMQLSATQGRRWLSESAINWPSQILRLKGEIVGPPGYFVRHKGCNLSKDSILDCLIVPDGHGRDSLLDLFDSIQTYEDSMPIHNGRCHPLVGLLMRPVDSWPSYERQLYNSGDDVVSELLLGILFRSAFDD